MRVEQILHDCENRPLGLEISKLGKNGLWYVLNHQVKDVKHKFHINFCPFCGKSLMKGTVINPSEETKQDDEVYE